MVIDEEKQKAKYKRYYYKHRVAKLLREKIKYDPLKIKEYNREYYLKHKRKIDKKNKKYDKEHPDKLKERAKRNYEEKIKNKRFIESFD